MCVPSVLRAELARRSSERGGDGGQTTDVVMDPGTIHKKVEVSVYDKAFRESNVVAGNQRSHRVEQNANNEEFMVSSVVRVCNAE
ncbi:hypothetical protein F2P81_004692 [Scophthalmus maximus]|uniref:Uncharacterized protein n=1 Tax=Scophthalmus maximus TaxID=52904 RepID=A0A6A4TDW0_SCOMX|nr:hypothetical protein F2P81_004692 [Scophthalmus maximus]